MEPSDSLNVLRRSTNLEFLRTQTWARSNGEALNLAELVNGLLEHPVRSVNRTAVECFHDISAALRKRSGRNPSGMWLPLQTFSRDYNTGGNPALLADKVHGEAPPGLLPSSGLVSAGATVLSGIRDGQGLALPYINTASGLAAWVNDEFTPIPPAAIAFDTAIAKPKSIAIELVVSHRLMRDSEIDLDALLRQELERRFSAAIDAAAIDGAGLSDPEGILRHSGLDVLPLGDDGGQLTYSQLAELERRVLSRAGGSMQAPAWIIGPKLSKKLRTTQKAVGAGMIFDGADLMGHRVIQTSAMPENLTKGSQADCSAVLFGDMAEVFVVFWGPAAVDFLVDSVTMRKDGKIRIIARAEVGIVTRRIDAFAAVKDAMTD